MRRFICVLIVALATPAFAQVPCVPVIANETLTPPVPGVVNAITSYDDLSGDGAQFFAAGTFSSLGNVVRLTSSGWQPVGPGLNGAVNALEVIDDGSGPGTNLALYAGGVFSGGLARWNGSGWDRVLPAPPGAVYAIARYDDGAGPTLFVFTLNNMYKYLGSSWQNIGAIQPYFGANGFPLDRVQVLDDDGPGPRRSSLFYSCASAYNLTSAAQTSTASGVVRFDGQSMEGLAGNPFNQWIKASVVFDDGAIGPALYAAGHPQSPMITGIARWNPASGSWVSLGTSTQGNEPGYGLAVWNDGVAARPRLYAIGGASLAIPVNGTIAAWNGQTWSSIYRRSIAVPTSTGFHLVVHAGTLGPAHIPALLSVRSIGSFFALVGCPRCPGDIDLDGQVTVADLFLYLNTWFAGQPSADIGGNGLTAQDILDFLSGWFQPCN